MKSLSCVVLLRHGEREDYMAYKAGKGADWISRASRPWDPPLAENGQKQAKAAAQRLRQILSDAGLVMPTRIFTSPLVRCVETANAVAEEFELSSLSVEEGLTETICEAWMRQWAVPGADSKWGGPPGAEMPQNIMHEYPQGVHGPPVGEGLRQEASAGLDVLLRKPSELKALGWDRIDADHKACIPFKPNEFSWGNFETKSQVIDRVLRTVVTRSQEHSEETLVFVSHGGPTTYALERLTGSHAKGAGGMTALSVLTHKSGAKFWDAILSNDAEHGKAFASGNETTI